MNKKSLCLNWILTGLAFLSLVGCAGTTANFPKQEELTSFQGFNEKAVIQKFGEPTNRRTDSNGNGSWVYKKQANGGFNSFIAISTVGAFSGNNAPYVDIMKITFRRHKVVNVTLEENVQNIDLNIPGMGSASSIAASNGYSIQEQPPQPPRVPAEISPPTMVAKEPKPAELTSLKSPTKNLSLTLTESGKFVGSIKTVGDKIVANAEKCGLKVISRIKSDVIFCTVEGNKITATLKKVKKEVRVELSAKGDTSISDYFCKILESCQ